ncbi:MAG: hypothetical protein AAF565_14905 [Pseudomonadota bacterium]
MTAVGGCYAQVMSRPDPHRRIITCCYCSSRSILPREGATRLVCHGCGAPIRVIEMLEAAPEKRKRKHKKKPAVPHPALERGDHKRKDMALRRRKGKRRKSLIDRLEDLIEDAWDEIEDIFD